MTMPHPSDDPAEDATLVFQSGDRQSFVLSPVSWAGGACDIGRVHELNQDALALAAGQDEQGNRQTVAAVSDGVSTSANSELASELAAQTACRALTEVLDQGTDSPDQLATAMVEAFCAANEAIQQAAGDQTATGWSCTLIVALVNRGTILVGNVGDTRAYWFPDQGQPLALSVDDSLAQARIEMGIDRELAETGAQAHAITKWLGPSAWDPTPRLSRLTPRGPGWLCVCSDGLWNYASAPADLYAVLAALLARPQAPSSAAVLSTQLVDWAIGQGGRDNITVALVRVDRSADPTG